MSEFEQYRHVDFGDTCEIRPYKEGEDMSEIRVSFTHRNHYGSPKKGDVIRKYNDRLFLIPGEYFRKKYEPVKQEQLQND